MSAVGTHIYQLNVPVCTSFEAKILNDQLCYEIDLNRFASKANVHNELELGFNFIMDYNEDRQITNNENVIEEENAGLASNFIESDKKNHAFIYLNTIGKNILTAQRTFDILQHVPEKQCYRKVVYLCGNRNHK